MESVINLNGLFIISYRNLWENKSGIGKKIRNQIQAFNNNGLNCVPLVQKSGRENLPSLLGKALYILPFCNVNPRWECTEEINNADFIYFRRPIAMTLPMRKFLKISKERNPNLKVFIEIPTYPYDTEYKTFLEKYFLKRDKFNRTKLQGLVDCFFVSDPMKAADNLYGIRTVRFRNGYDVKATQKRIYQEHGKKIILTCVAMFSFWHGYERLLYGLAEYYKHNNATEDILVNFVGIGAELENYQNLVQKLDLKDHVCFHGKLFGEDLDRIYAQTDMGIGCLGCYKKDINVIGDLKTREYLAKGIPVISGCKVDLFTDGQQLDFYKEVPNDPSPIDIDQIVEFHKYIQEQRGLRNIEEELHQYALDNFDYDDMILDIVDEIKRNLR